MELTTGYSVVVTAEWSRLGGTKTHLGYNQEAYEVGCADRASALDRVTIFTDAQAASKGVAAEDPGPGQTYAIRASQHITVLRRRVRPDVTIEIRWRPTHKTSVRMMDVRRGWSRDTICASLRAPARGCVSLPCLFLGSVV